MAKKFLTGLTLVNLDSDPLVGSEGELYFNTSASVAKIYKAGAWTEIGGGTGLSSIGSTPPESPQIGQTWFNDSNGSFYIYDGEFWVEITSVISLTQEEVQDYAAPLLNHSNHINISASYDDSSNKIILSASASGTGTGVTISETAPEDPSIGDAWFNNVTGSYYLYDGTYWVEVNGVISIEDEQLQDIVAPLFTHNNHTNVVATYDDANNQILLNTSASITNIDSIVYPDYITFDTTPETIPTAQGSIYWDSGDAGLRVVANNTTLLLGQEQYALVKNETGSSIAKGKVVYINGAQGQRPTIALADADTEPTSSKTFGFTAESIDNGAEGLVVTEGILRGINTNGLTSGGAVWLSSTAGNFTQTIPTQPVHSVFLGYVVKAHASSGEIYVKIQNGYELQELHNVLINGVSDNQALVYNSSASLWQNESLVNSLSGTANEINVSASVGNITIGLPDDVTISNDLTVLGNLTVSGSTTTLNTTELNVEDNIITLNSGVSGSPSLNAGIEVERGDSNNVQIRWNESLDVWEFTNDGTTYSELGSGSGALYQAEAPVGAEIGTIWVDSNASAGIINSNDFVLKSEAEAYTPHGFLLMGG